MPDFAFRYDPEITYPEDDAEFFRWQRYFNNLLCCIQSNIERVDIVNDAERFEQLNALNEQVIKKIEALAEFDPTPKSYYQHRRRTNDTQF